MKNNNFDVDEKPSLMVVSVASCLNVVGVESNVYKILLKSRKMEERKKLAFKAIAQYLKYENTNKVDNYY